MIKIYQKIFISFTVALILLYIIVGSFVSDNSINYKNFIIDERVTAMDRSFMLKNILSDDDEILKSELHKKIFFIESHQSYNRRLENSRQACSVESAGKCRTMISTLARE